MIFKSLCAMVFLSALHSSFCQVHGQNSKGDNAQFVDSERIFVEDSVVDYGANREKFPVVACRMTMQVEEKRFGSGPKNPDTYTVVDLMVFEDLNKSLRRSSVRQSLFQEEDESLHDWLSCIKAKEVYKLVSGGVSLAFSKERLASVAFLSIDPWMLPICEPATMMERATGDALYWKSLINLDRLIYTQTNQSTHRGEWFGAKKELPVRIQVYFDPKYGNMPFLTKVLHVKDEDAKFGEEIIAMKSETLTKWEEHGNGCFRPKAIRMERLNRVPNTGAVSTTLNISIDFNWESAFLKPDGSLDETVFDWSSKGIIDDVLFDSFK